MFRAYIIVLRSFTALACLFVGLIAAHAQMVPSDTCAETSANEWSIDDCHTLIVPNGYTVDTSVPNSCATPSLDAFVWFTATSDSTYIAISSNNLADADLQVFTGTCGALTEEACLNDLGPGFGEHRNIPTVSGTTYLVRVMTVGLPDSLPYSNLCIEPTPLPPVNGDPCSAIFLPVTATCDSATDATNEGSLTTVDIGDPCRDQYCSGDVWFKTVVPSTGHLIIDTQCLSVLDGGMSLYTTTGGCASTHLQHVICNDDSSSTGNEMPKLDVTSGLTVGDTVYIRFWAYSGEENEFRICASSGTTTLPVEFIALHAQADQGVVAVTWSTATEQNSDHFVVERSADDSVFEGIGELPAAGESSVRHDYSYTDAAPPSAMVYYRVREVDHNGSSMLTSTVVAFPSASSSAPLLYPNPVAEVLNIGFTAEWDGNAQVIVVDGVGRILLQQDLAGVRGRRSAQLDLHALVQGYYAVRITLPSGEVLRAGGFIKR